MNKLLVKQISLFSGGGLVFLAGLFYVLMTDLKMKNSATWLFIGVILALGSSILFLLSENAKEKKVPYLIMKASSVLLAIGFVVFLFAFKHTDVATSKLALANVIVIVDVILTILGIVLQGVNILFSYLTRNDE